MASRDKLVDLEVELVLERELSYRVRGDRGQTVWIPKSECEFELSSGSQRHGILTLPTWLATEKELV